jgi:predicted RNA-binding protein YlqC (UPF0109 family)
LINNKIMETKKKGRKPLKEGDKVMLVSVYLKKEDKEAVVAKYGSVTNAIKEEVLPRLDPPKNANI